MCIFEMSMSNHVKLNQHLLKQTLTKLFFIHLLLVLNKCGGRCDTIDDPYAPVWVPNKVKM